MIGLVIVTHGGLAAEFVSAMEHVVGPQRGVAAICIGPDDDMERRRQDILDAADAVDEGQGVILLTDMFGGTPSNLAISIMEQTAAEVIVTCVSSLNAGFAFFRRLAQAVRPFRS